MKFIGVYQIPHIVDILEKAVESDGYSTIHSESGQACL